MKLFIFSLLLSIAGLAAGPSAPRPDLAGTVSFHDSAPVKDAAVFIYAAGPKEGRGTL